MTAGRCDGFVTPYAVDVFMTAGRCDGLVTPYAVDVFMMKWEPITCCTGSGVLACSLL